MAIQIRQITPYTGDVPVPGQAPAVFSQNSQDQLGFMNSLADELVNTISDMNDSATEMEENAGKAENAANTAEALLSGNGYKGLWPDTGGSANKGDTYQTQVGGTPTGNYFTALQNTTVDPVGDNVNWKSETERFDKKYEPRRHNATFIFEGDSITEGNTIDGYKYSDVMSNLSFAKGWITRTLNRAVGGSQIGTGENNGNNITDRYASQVFPHRPTSNGGDGGDVAYLFLMIGTNDLDTRFGNKHADTVVTQLTSYVQQAMSDGFTVVLQTILPRISNQNGWNVQTEEYRLGINVGIRRGTIPSDIVADTESFVNDVTSFAMFHDGIHPTQLGADMIAAYLNNVLTSDGSLSQGNVIQGRPIQGLFNSKDKTMVKVGSEYCATSLGTDLNENKNGFLVIDNLNAPSSNERLWFFEAGVDGTSKVKILPIGSGGSGSGKPALTFNRVGTRSWTEYGNAFQQTYMGNPFSDTDFGAMYMQNKNPVGLGVNERWWSWQMETSASRPESYKLVMLDDDGSNPVNALEFKRTGKNLTSMAVNGQISTGSNTGNISDGNWALGTIKANGDNNNQVNITKYVQIEINGELVNLAVINDPSVS